MENRWQPISAATWCAPSSCSTSFIAEKIGRSGQPVQKPGGRAGTTAARARTGSSSSTAAALARGGRSAATSGAAAVRKPRMPSSSTATVYSPAIGRTLLPIRRAGRSASRSIFARACSMKSGWPSSTTSTACLSRQKSNHFRRHQRVGDVQDVERHAGVAPDVGQASPHQRPHHAVVHAALQDDADLLQVAGEELVHAVRLDEVHRGGPSARDLVPLMGEARRRQDDAAGVAQRGVARLRQA